MAFEGSQNVGWSAGATEASMVARDASPFWRSCTGLEAVRARPVARQAKALRKNILFSLLCRLLGVLEMKLADWILW